MEKKEITKITFPLVVSYIIGLIFLFTGIVMISTGYIGPGIAIIIISLAIIPKTEEELFTKYLHIKFSFGIKIILMIIIVVIISIIASQEGKTQEPTIIIEENVSKNEEASTRPKENESGTLNQSTITKTINIQKLDARELYDELGKDSKNTDLKKDNIFQEKYEGKYFIFDGKILDIETDFMDYPVVYVYKLIKTETDSTGFLRINYGILYRVYLSQESKDKILDLQKGDLVEIKGKFSSYSKDDWFSIDEENIGIIVDSVISIRKI